MNQQIRSSSWNWAFCCWFCCWKVPLAIEIALTQMPSSADNISFLGCARIGVDMWWACSFDYISFKVNVYSHTFTLTWLGVLYFTVLYLRMWIVDAHCKPFCFRYFSVLWLGLSFPPLQLMAVPFYSVSYAMNSCVQSASNASNASNALHSQEVCFIILTGEILPKFLSASLVIGIFEMETALLCMSLQF